MLVALPLGIFSALRPGSIADRVTTVFCFAGISVPTFWLALMLILILAVTLRWFKTSGYGGLEYIVLPTLSLSWYTSGRMAQMVRSCMLDEMDRPYLTTARAKGLAEHTVVVVHALRNAAIPIITMTGDQLAHLASGAVIIEVIFGWPGVGQLAIAAIERRDFPVIQADVLVVAAIVILLNLLVDILYGWMDPRIRYQ
jgi:peptide/nickel transport system permease protein